MFLVPVSKTLEDPHRFKRSRDVGCYLGLRPGSSQSGETNPGMRISKEGGGFLQLLSLPLSPCRPYHPAEASRRVSQLRRSVLSSPDNRRLDLRI